jgi:hypothetical protein
LEPIGNTKETDLNIDQAADHDQFSHFPDEHPAQEERVNSEDIPSPTTTAPAKSRWRPARPPEGNPCSDTIGR